MPNPTDRDVVQNIEEKKQPSDLTSSKASIERTFGRTRATFGAGAAVREIQTAFESRRVTLSNLSHKTTKMEIITIAETLGTLKSATLTSPAPGTAGKAELEYLDMNSAKTAAAALDGHELHSQRITSQLNLKSVDIDTADLRSSTLKISWFAPSRIAYAHYDTISTACDKASFLDGKAFVGRNVSATFQSPTVGQRSSFTVIVKGLPHYVPLPSLKRFCGTNSVTLSQTSHHGKEGTERIRKLLEDFGPLETFDYSPPKLADLKVKVLARFVKAEDAADAEIALHGQSHRFLGGAKTWITLLHSIKYSIPMAQFDALRDEFQQIQHTGDQTAKIRVYDKDEAERPVDPVGVRLYGSDPKALCRLKSRVEGIVSGEELRYEGAPLWDDFFHGKGSRLFLEDIQKKSGAFVLRDSRRKNVRVSGRPDKRRMALELLLKKALELRAQRHRISLTKSALGRLLQGGFARLQATLGADKLTLDIRRRTLIVQGGEEDIEVTRLSLMALESNVAIPAIGDGGDCPVCMCNLTNPVQLACGHTYCFGCLRLYLISAESFPIKCFAEDGRCDQAIPLATLSHILPPTDETKLLETAFQAYIHEHPSDYHYCPTPDCELIYRPGEPGKVLRCSACLARICAHCHVENHEGLTCEQHHDNTSGGDLFAKWKQENNVSACPGCGAAIEKDGGCNHITCVRCGTHMCWVCKKTFKAGEIYAHMSMAHGGWGLD